MNNCETNIMEIDQKKLWKSGFIFIAIVNLAISTGNQMAMTGMPLYAAELGANNLIVGLMTTCATITSLMIRPFTGYILDRFPKKGILIMSLAAITVIIPSYVVFPVLGILLALRLFHGIASGLVSTSTYTIVADCVPTSRFAEGIGYYSLTTSISFAVGPGLAISTVEESGGKNMILIAASFSFLALALSCFQDSKKDRNPHEAAGKKKFRISSLFDQQALLPTMLMFFLVCSYGATTTFIALHCQTNGVDGAWMFFTAYAVITIITRPITGKLTDRIGLFIPGAVAIVLAIAGAVLVAFVDNMFLICMAGILNGLGIGTSMGTFQTMAVAPAAPYRRGVATSTFLLRRKYR